MRCMSSSGLLNSVDEVYFVTTFSTQRHEKKTFTSFYAFDLNILLDVKEIYDFQENKHISPFPILFLCFFCELYHWNFWSFAKLFIYTAKGYLKQCVFISSRLFYATINQWKRFVSLRALVPLKFSYFKKKYLTLYLIEKIEKMCDVNFSGGERVFSKWSQFLTDQIVNCLPSLQYPSKKFVLGAANWYLPIESRDVVARGKPKT